MLSREMSSLLIPVFLLASACHPGAGDSDTGPLVPSPPLDITATVSELVPTVVTVRWTTESPTTGSVAFGPSADYAWQTPEETTPSTEHEALLLGLWAEADFHFEVTTDAGGAVERSGDYAVTTGSLLTTLPEFEVTGTESGHWMITSVAGSTNAAVVLDEAGRIVWYAETSSEMFNSRVVASHDHESVLVLSAGRNSSSFSLGSIERFAWTGEHLETIALPYVTHDFLELPDGTIAALVLGDPEDEGGEDGGTSRIVEVAPDGSSKVIFDALTYARSTPGWDDSVDFTLMNALTYDPKDDAYYASIKSISSIVKVDRASGEPLWALGGPGNAFEAGPGLTFPDTSHQFEVLDDGLLLFHNGEADVADSRIVHYKLDFDTWTATEGWTYHHDPPLFVYFDGDVARLDNGETVITWCSAGQLQRVSEAEEVLWQLDSPLGIALGYNTVVDTLYP